MTKNCRPALSALFVGTLGALFATGAAADVTVYGIFDTDLKGTEDLGNGLTAGFIEVPQGTPAFRRGRNEVRSEATHTRIRRCRKAVGNDANRYPE